MENLIFNNFSNVFAFRDAVTNRPDNGHAKHSARDNSEDFSGMPLDDAIKAVSDGVPAIADSLKLELTRFSNLKCCQVIKRRTINYYNGYSPNVPAAIIGLPKSMRKTIKTPQKVKTVTLYYVNCVNCDVEADTINRAGATTLQLAYWINLNGYSVKIVAIPWMATKDNDLAVCTVTLKEFNQPMDVLKMSFSLGSVSMFRRLGFRWLETVPGLTSHNWKYDYGHSETSKPEIIANLKKVKQNTENAYIITINECKKVKFDPLKLAENMGIKVG